MCDGHNPADIVVIFRVVSAEAWAWEGAVRMSGRLQDKDDACLPAEHAAEQCGVFSSQQHRSRDGNLFFSFLDFVVFFIDFYYFFKCSCYH